MKYLWFLIWLAATQTPSFAQERPVGHIVVCGKWDNYKAPDAEKTGAKPPAIIVFGSHLIPDFLNDQKRYNISIQRDSFYAVVPLTKNLQYIQFSSFGGSPRGFADDHRALRAFYMVQPGDSIHITRYAQEPISIASDSPLFDYQYRLFSSILPKAPRVSIKSVRHNLDVLLKDVFTSIGMEDQVSPIQPMAPELSALVKQNFRSFILSSACQRIYNSVLGGHPDSLDNALLQKLDSSLHHFEQVANANLLASSKHLEFLFYLNSAKGTLEARLAGAEKTDHSQLAQAIYYQIRRGYQGSARDKLMDMFFKWSVDMRVLGKKGIPLIHEALPIIKDQEVRHGLIKRLNGYTGGEKVYDGQFIDRRGNPVRLSDFRGRIVVAHFWFLGCVPCIEMTKNLSPLMEEMVDHPDLVFLNINVDETKERWLAGLKSGKYSHEQELLLHSGSLGMGHPLLKHYGYIGMPSLLLIDRNGNVISSRPPESYAPLRQLIISELEKTN